MISPEEAQEVYATYVAWTTMGMVKPGEGDFYGEPMPKDYTELAKMIGVSTRTLRRWQHREDLQALVSQKIEHAMLTGARSMSLEWLSQLHNHIAKGSPWAMKLYYQWWQDAERQAALRLGDHERANLPSTGSHRERVAVIMKEMVSHAADAEFEVIPSRGEAIADIQSLLED